MSYIKILYSIIKKDFLQFLRNKTIVIVIILPILASLFFLYLDNSTINNYYKLGYAEVLTESNFNPDKNGNSQVEWIAYSSRRKALKDLSDELDGILLIDDHTYIAHLNTSSPAEMLLLEDIIQEEIEENLNYNRPYNLEINIKGNVSSSADILPIWLTITIAMIGIIIISGDIAEEKEEKSLEAIIIAPIHAGIFILGKILSGTLLTLLTGLIIFGFAWFNNPAQFDFLILIKYISLIIAGAIIFNIIGIIIGLKTNSQSAARSVGTIIYFPLIFPSLLYQFSDIINYIARITPTYYLMEGFNHILVATSDQLIIWPEISILLIFSLLMMPFLLLLYKGVYK
ncbi:MAG: ABC transporter permease [Bacillota bacterium]